mgnify:CR=1 FL=1
MDRAALTRASEVAAACMKARLPHKSFFTKERAWEAKARELGFPSPYTQRIPDQQLGEGSTSHLLGCPCAVCLAMGETLSTRQQEKVLLFSIINGWTAHLDHIPTLLLVKLAKDGWATMFDPDWDILEDLRKAFIMGSISHEDLQPPHLRDEHSAKWAVPDQVDPDSQDMDAEPIPLTEKRLGHERFVTIKPALEKVTATISDSMISKMDSALHRQSRKSQVEAAKKFMADNAHLGAKQFDLLKVPTFPKELLACMKKEYRESVNKKELVLAGRRPFTPRVSSIWAPRASGHPPTGPGTQGRTLGGPMLTTQLPT